MIVSLIILYLEIPFLPSVGQETEAERVSMHCSQAHNTLSMTGVRRL